MNTSLARLYKFIHPSSHKYKQPSGCSNPGIECRRRIMSIMSICQTIELVGLDASFLTDLTGDEQTEISKKKKKKDPMAPSSI